MASPNMPLPVPPRTPTPPPEDQANAAADTAKPQEITIPEYNPDALSPMSAGFPPRSFGASLGGRLGGGGGAGAGGSPLSPLSPMSVYSPMSIGGSSDGGGGAGGSPSVPLSAGSVISAGGAPNPFNFQTVQYTAGRPSAATKSDLGRRRGHKYKHSSVSHQIFLEPPPGRAPLQLPASLPMPTARECWRSMSREQTLRAAWCFCHLTVALLVQQGAHGSLAVAALSRLLFFDSVGAFLCVIVDVGGNFEIWKRSSVQWPFGLERLEVVVGLGMAVALAFLGLDIISHNLNHLLAHRGGHAPHMTHAHDGSPAPGTGPTSPLDGAGGPAHADRVSPGSVDLAALAAIVATLTSALALRNHARVGRVMRLDSALLAALPLPPLLANPSHLLTLSCSALLLLLPLLSVGVYAWLDAALAGVMAAAMVALGGRLGARLASILLMSYGAGGGGKGVEAVLDEVRRDESIVEVQEAKFWQVHYGLCQANLKIRVKAGAAAGTADGDQDAVVNRVREKVESLVRNRLGGGYGRGSGGVRWEVSTQVAVDTSGAGGAGTKGD
ncbi:cation efflux family-domain-containing protein [Lineolata rhizophorae]|uniref:Zinc transporter n=1 Tax=Lineolata rhizophorae TaxID=578093 RepID=A0A6A6P1P1_9PEZI|nr:cation efflux family-domain-containing protein [Lineolata rhizophorae]